MNDLFLHDSLDTLPIVFSDRVLYTPASFAKIALLYLQESGNLQAKELHTSLRTRIVPPVVAVVDSFFQYDYVDDLPEISEARRTVGIAPGRPVLY